MGSAEYGKAWNLFMQTAKLRKKLYDGATAAQKKKMDKTYAARKAEYLKLKAVNEKPGNEEAVVGLVQKASSDYRDTARGKLAAYAKLTEKQRAKLSKRRKEEIAELRRQVRAERKASHTHVPRVEGVKDFRRAQREGVLFCATRTTKEECEAEKSCVYGHRPLMRWSDETSDALTSKKVCYSRQIKFAQEAKPVDDEGNAVEHDAMGAKRAYTTKKMNRLPSGIRANRLTARNGFVCLVSHLFTQKLEGYPLAYWRDMMKHISEAYDRQVFFEPDLLVEVAKYCSNRKMYKKYEKLASSKNGFAKYDAQSRTNVQEFLETYQEIGVSTADMCSQHESECAALITDLMPVYLKVLRSHRSK